MTPKTMAVVAKQAIKYQFGVDVYLSWMRMNERQKKI